MKSSPQNLPEGIDRVIVDIVIRLAFLVLLIYWAGVLVGPFVIIVIWAAVLAVALLPVYQWLKERLGGKGSLASFVITIVALGMILGPVGLLATSALENAKELTASLEDGTFQVPPPDEGAKDWPLIGDKVFAAWTKASTNLSAFLNQHAELMKSVATGFLSAAAGLGGGVLGFTASIIIAAFFYGRSASLTDSLGAFAVRVLGDEGRGFVIMSGATIRNVARGVVGISFAQALLIGIGMMLAGVPATGLLTLIILILCIIQLGPTLIVLPVIIWAWLNLDAVGALVFMVYMVICNFGDSAIKPVVLAKGLRTPMLVIFIGVIGGTFAHGLIGLFLGPIVLAVFYDLYIAWVTFDKPVDDNDTNSGKDGPIQS